MPRQTNAKEIFFPDGFQFAVGDTTGNYYDVGVLAGGAQATLSWDDFYLDGGNYEGLVDKMKNPTFQLAPSALWNWDTGIISRIMSGLVSDADAAGSPTAGTINTYTGASNHLTLNRIPIRLTHFPDVKTIHELIEDDITAISTGTNNQLVTVAKTVFTNPLPWTEYIDLYTDVDSMDEVAYGDRDVIANRGDYCTDDTNLYFIVESGTYGDLAAAKTALAGTDVEFYDDTDWQFMLYNARIDSGAAFNFKGVNEDGLNEYTVGFTAKPDPANLYRLFKFFKAT